MTRSELVSELAPAISDLGGRFMSDPVGFGRAGEMNIEPGIGVYVVGRFGVLGRVHPDVVVASAVFIEPSMLAAGWNTALQTADPGAAATVYTSIAAEYGRAHIAAAPGLRRWIELAESVVDGCSPVGAPIFAGWRAMPRPDEAAGRAYLLLHILRELRFAMHANAVVAAGVDPLMAILCGPGGDKSAGMLGWPAPYPDLTESDMAARRSVEATTNDLSVRSMDSLSDVEMDEFVRLTKGIAESAV